MLSARISVSPWTTRTPPVAIHSAPVERSDSFAEIQGAVPSLLRFRPDPARIRRFLHAAMRTCLPGTPVLVDRSEENALRLAGSIERVAREAVKARTPSPALA